MSAAETVDAIAKADGTAKGVKAAVSDPAAIRRLFDEAEAPGRLAALVNSAGVIKLAPISSAGENLFDQHVAIDLKAVFLGIRKAAKRMGEGGQIDSFSSSVVGFYQPTYGTYAATKAGVGAITQIAAKGFSSKGIVVNAIAPGPVATALFLDDKTDEQIVQTQKVILLSRLAELNDNASVIAFLVGPDGGWVSGHVIRANGGVV